MKQQKGREDRHRRKSIQSGNCILGCKKHQTAPNLFFFDCCFTLTTIVWLVMRLSCWEWPCFNGNQPDKALRTRIQAQKRKKERKKKGKDLVVTHVTHTTNSLMCGDSCRAVQSGVERNKKQRLSTLLLWQWQSRE